MVELPETEERVADENDSLGREPVAKPADGTTPQLDLEDSETPLILRALRTCAVLTAEEHTIGTPYARNLFRALLGDTNISTNRARRWCFARQRSRSKRSLTQPVLRRNGAN